MISRREFPSERDETTGVRSDPVALILIAAACVVAAAGWWVTWFFTDDAFITFRYASNWIAGRGPVWNPPPFQPVEGYSNFLWLVVVTAVWKVFGVEPPAVANGILLGFGLITLWLTADLCWRALDGRSRAARRLLFGLALLWVATNRTFVTWLSSGLETSLFTCCAVAWLRECVRVAADPRRSLASVAFAASLMALTRPDGLLFWGVTVLLVAADRWWLRPSTPDGARTSLPATLAALSPVVLHVGWRRSFYGEWLPNTYYAKLVAPWPEMGARYLAAFVLEYGLYVWLIAACLGAVSAVRRSAFRDAGLRRTAILGAVAATVAMQVGYYVVMVGGDHFEFRILHHLVPFAAVSMLFLLRGIRPPAGIAASVLVAWIAAESFIPWTHWALAGNRLSRIATYMMVVPVAPALPFPLRPVGALWDSMQAAMIPHLVGSRQQEHKHFYFAQVASFPPRSEGERMSWELDRPVLAGKTIGVPGWVFPNAAIIDVAGLNDRLIARAAIRPGERRQMAHDRVGSVEYQQCFRPNLSVAATPMCNAHVLPFAERPRDGLCVAGIHVARETPLLPEQIVDCETREWKSVASSLSDVLEAR